MKQLFGSFNAQLFSLTTASSVRKLFIHILSAFSSVICVGSSCTFNVINVFSAAKQRVMSCLHLNKHCRERVKDSTVTTNELISSATGKLYRDDQWEIFHPRILHTGEVRQIVGGRFSSKCLINIASYPFDEQRCSLNFENWMYTTQEVELLPVENLTREELLSSYSPSGEWEMLNVWHERKVMEYCCPPIFFSSVNFVLHMKRKPLYYVMNVVVPAIMLSLLVLLVLRLPPESGEKISMGVTLLLSFAVYILMVSENVPNTSEGVPLIGELKLGVLLQNDINNISRWYYENKIKYEY